MSKSKQQPRVKFQETEDALDQNVHLDNSTKKGDKFFKNGSYENRVSEKFMDVDDMYRFMREYPPNAGELIRLYYSLSKNNDTTESNASKGSYKDRSTGFIKKTKRNRTKVNKVPYKSEMVNKCWLSINKFDCLEDEMVMCFPQEVDDPEEEEYVDVYEVKKGSTRPTRKRLSKSLSVLGELDEIIKKNNEELGREKCRALDLEKTCMDLRKELRLKDLEFIAPAEEKDIIASSGLDRFTDDEIKELVSLELKRLFNGKGIETIRRSLREMEKLNKLTNEYIDDLETLEIHKDSPVDSLRELILEHRKTLFYYEESGLYDF